MKIAVYSAHDYDRDGLNAANAEAGHELLFIKAPLSADTARQAAGCGAACIFVNDHADAAALRVDRIHIGGRAELNPISRDQICKSTMRIRVLRQRCQRAVTLNPIDRCVVIISTGRNKVGKPAHPITCQTAHRQCAR